MIVELSHQQILFLQDIAKQANFVDYSIQINKSNSKDGILGEITFVKIKETHTGKVLGLVIKTAHVGEARTKAPVSKCYQREIFAYTVIFNEFEKLQNEYNVLNKWNSTAKCYGVSAKENMEFLILENLREQSYKMCDKKKTMDLNHTELVFKEYAKYHALSFALRKLKPVKFEELTTNLTNVFYGAVSEEDLKISANIMFGKVAKLVEDVPTAYAALKKFESDVTSLLFSLCFYEDKKNGIISHGDCWCNNMMFKYKGSPEVPTQLKFIDFQVAQYNSPTADLAHFFYLTSSGKSLEDYKKLLKVYHESLTDMLKEFNLDANDIFSFEELEREWKKYAKYGLYMAIFYLNMLLGESKDLSELSDDGNFMDIFNAGNVSDEYNRRIRSIIISMTENNLI